MVEEIIKKGFTEGTYYERLYTSSLSLIKSIDAGLKTCSSASDLSIIKGLISVVEGSSVRMSRLYQNYFDHGNSSEVRELHEKLFPLYSKFSLLEKSLK